MKNLTIILGVSIVSSLVGIGYLIMLNKADPLPVEKKRKVLIMWEGNPSRNHIMESYVNYNVYGEGNGVNLTPLIAVIFKSNDNNPPSFSHSFSGGTNPKPIYFNGKELKFERDTFPLYYMTPNKEMGTVYVPTSVGRDFFRLNARHSREEVLVFWDKYIANEIK